MSAYEPHLAPVLPMRRPQGAHRNAASALIIKAAERVGEVRDGTFSAREVYDDLVRDGHAVSWPRVRRQVTRGLAGREGSLEAVFVEVTAGRYRFRAGEPISPAPLEPPRPGANPPTSGETASVPPRGCRAAILEAATELVVRDPHQLFRIASLMEELEARGHRYSRTTVKENLCRMAGVELPGRRSYDDLERVALGVYRIRPRPNG